MKTNFIYEKVNNLIIEKLESGKIPWKRTWTESVPMNYLSKKMYRGINFMILSCTVFASPYFVTFLQCKEKKESIKSGEKGFPIVFWKLINFRPEDPQDNREIPFIKYSTVFNLQQTTLFDDTKIEADSKMKFEAEEIINNLPEKLTLKNNFSKCYYTPDEDYISTPTITNFSGSNEYYSTLFHELVHWTGHPKRLNRFEKGKFDEDNYSFEELVAEIGSAYLCNLSNIKTDEIITNQAGYIQGWLSKLKNDKKLIFKASAAAQKAVNFILNKEEKENE